MNDANRTVGPAKIGTVTDISFRPSEFYTLDEPCIEAAVASGKGSIGAQLIDLVHGDATIAPSIWTQSVAYSDAGRYLVCGTADGELSAFDLMGSAKLVLKTKLSKTPILSVAAGPGALTKREALVAYAVSDGRVFRVRHKGEKKPEVTEIEPHSTVKDGEYRGCNLVAAHGDSDLALFAFWHRDPLSGTIKTDVVFGDFEGRRPDLLVLPRQETSFVRQLAFLPNRCQFAICDEHSVELWSIGIEPKLMRRLEIKKEFAPYAAQQRGDVLVIVCG
jgi:hypothetical protein